jgi:predicted metal-dependent peptidase
MSEVMGILCSYEQVNARLIFWDYQVCEENDHLITRDNKDSLINMAIANCNGGTRFSCYTEYLKEKNYRSRINIIFTDGEIESKPEVPEGTNIFVLTKKGIDNIVKNYGIVCRISDIDE